MKTPLNIQNFKRVLVLGSSKLSENHVRAWKMIGFDAKISTSLTRPFSQSNGEQSDLLLDIYETNFAKRATMFEKALRAKASVIASEPLLKNLDSSKRMLRGFRKRKSALLILDPIAHHPLIALSKKEISKAKKIGDPRILRLELVTHDRSLSEYTLNQALHACELLFEPRKIINVFARNVRTRTSNLFVILANLEGERSIAHIVAGNSSAKEKFEFAINGTKGMLSFNESKTLELTRVKYASSALGAARSVEVLAQAFSSAALQGMVPTSPSQVLAEAVLKSLKSGRAARV